MKLLNSSGDSPYFKHRIWESCLIGLTSSNDVSVCVMKDDTHLSLTMLKDHVSSFFSNNPDASLKLVGSTNWELILGPVFKELGIDSSSTIKIFPNETQVMIDARRGLFKIKKAELKNPVLSGIVSPEQKYKIMVIDDSATMRKVLKNVIQSDAQLSVGAEAVSAEEGFEKLESFSPDLITLDINLPGMDGVEFLREMKNKEISVPVIVITSLNMNDGDKVFEALQCGAIDYIQKPDMSEIAKSQSLICDKIKTAAKANFEVAEFNAGVRPLGLVSYTESANSNIPVFIGSSTGGTTAIERMLKQMAAPIPPIVIVQHIPSVFSKAFADRLNNTFDFTVKEAEDGEIVKPNSVYIAPGGLQMGIAPVGSDGKIKLAIRDLPPVNRFKPSVDFLFESVAINYEGPKVALIMTGMGKDGAQGMLSMKQAGNTVSIAQDKSSSVVFGMPKAAIDLGSADIICHLDEIPKKLRDTISQLYRSERKSA